MLLTPVNHKSLGPPRPGGSFILLVATFLAGFWSSGCNVSLTSESDPVISPSAPQPTLDPADSAAAGIESAPGLDGLGACCIGVRCIDTFPDVCPAEGGVFRGQGTTCEEDACVLVPPEVAALLGDCDEDGMTDLEELAQGMDPCDPQHDLDIDDDGIPNAEDPDVDGDGVPNAYDRDVDGDGLHNSIDRDIDGDGEPNVEDDDDDGDGVSDDVDNDDDADGDDDEDDDDDDEDDEDCESIADCKAGQVCREGKCVDPAKCESDDDCTDPDEVCSDGECVDPLEYIRFLFNEEEQDELEGATCGLSKPTNATAKCNVRLLTENDMDGDGVLDFKDSDMDGDGEPNATDSDIDGDGISNQADPDIDGDGLSNNFDEDDDGDGIPDEADSDANSDGIPD